MIWEVAHMKTYSDSHGTAFETVSPRLARQIEGGAAFSALAVGFDDDWCGTKVPRKFPFPPQPFGGGIPTLGNLGNFAQC
jgi:hypothetical protein